METKRTDLAYIAGLIDGEGCITVKQHRSKAGLTRFDISVEVAMVANQPVQLIQALFGGNIYHRPPNNRGKLDYSKIMLSGEKAATMLKLILPYLLVKKPQAELALRVVNAHPKYQRYTLVERFLQEADALAIKTLNSG